MPPALQLNSAWRQPIIPPPAPDPQSRFQSLPARAFDIPIAPHYNWDIHTQLVATIPNGLFVEYFVRGSDVKVFDEVLENPIYPTNGFIAPRTEPGFGMRFRGERLEHYRIA